MKIGIFDSGFGGLSIMRAVVKVLPQYDYVYLGDTARTPYGTRSQQVIYDFTQQAVTFLFAQDCALVVIACNTASAEALHTVQKRIVPQYPGHTVLGVIIPAVEAALATTHNNRIGVLATEGSVASGAFVREIADRAAGVTVVQQACPMLVPLIESGERDGDILAYYIRRYTQPLTDAGVDTIVLGCTHYEFLAQAIQDIVGADIALIREGGVVAQKLSAYLTRHGDVAQLLSTHGTRTFYTTDLSEHFTKKGSEFYGKQIVAQHAVIDDACHDH